MKRIRCCLLVLGMCLFFVSAAWAQQDPGFIPVWDDSLNLIDSLIFQTADGRLVIDTAPTPPNPLLTLSNSGNGPVLQVSGLTGLGGSTNKLLSITQSGGGAGIGLEVITSTTLGQAIEGACSATFVDCFGVVGVGSIGVRGDGGGTGVQGSGASGVRGIGSSIGISGIGNGPGALAGRFQGDVVITGNLSKGGGMFKIDHPLDPANKYLSHSFVESPDMMNIYNGIVFLDHKGEAWVNLPDWFEGLNRDFRYQLTAIGAPAPKLYVAEEISGNRFKIAGGKSRGKVSWQVTGVRQDAYANAHRITVEEDKPLEEQGYYLHPELFGQPAAKSIDVLRTPAPVTVHGASNDREVASHR